MEEQVAGMRTTGRRVAGPAADLIEVVGEQGRKHTALVFHPRYREHAALGAALSPVLPFLRAPGVDGLLPVIKHVAAEGAFLYPAGTAWSVAEIVRVLADSGEQAGIRAGLELCYLTAQILSDAYDAAAPHRLSAHRSLDPRKILVKPDGRVLVIGYGLPPVDMLEHLETQRRPKEEDTVRYAPPERFEEMEEDLTSDLYCLALVGLELSFGRPIYDGLVDDVRQAASRGEANRRVYALRERLPDPVREAYSRALKPDPDTRFRSGVDFVYAFHDLLGSLDAEGPPLAEVMGRFRKKVQAGRAFDGGATGALTREELAELALDEGDARPLPPPNKPRPPEPGTVPEVEEPSEQRWGSVSRPARKEEESPRDKLLNRLQQRGAEPASAVRAAPTSAARGVAPVPAAGAEARDRLKERLRSRTSGAGATGRPRRIERGGDDENDEAEDEVTPRIHPPSPEAPASVDDVVAHATAAAPVAMPPDDAPSSPELAPAAVEVAPAAVEVAPPEVVVAPAPVVVAPQAEAAPPPLVATAPPAAPPASAPRPAPAGSAAAALLERLRGGATRVDAARVEPPRVEPARVEPPRVEAPRVEPPRVATGQAPPPLPVEASSPPPMVAPPPLARSEAPAPSPRLTWQVVVEGAVPRSLEVSPAVPVARTVSRIAEQLDLLSTDLLGNVTGWWVAEQRGARLPGTTPTERIDAASPVHLIFVPNRVIPIEIVVHAAGAPTRFRAPVATAVPARLLLAHLVRWLALPPGAWSLSLGGATLGPDQILAEFEPALDATLLVSP